MTVSDVCAVPVLGTSVVHERGAGRVGTWVGYTGVGTWEDYTGTHPAR